MQIDTDPEPRYCSENRSSCIGGKGVPLTSPLNLKDHSLVTSYLRRYPPEVSELTFTNLFVWRKSRPITFAEVEDSLLFFVEAAEGGVIRRVMFGPPAGESSAVKVIRSFVDAASCRVGKRLEAASASDEIEGVVRIPERTANELAGAGFRVEEDRDNWDYVYRVEDLSELAGRRFHKKRNLVKQCLEGHKCAHGPITEANLAECLDFQERWCKARQCVVEPGLCRENLAIREMFGYYKELGLFGSAIRVEGRIEAYAVGEELSPGKAVCHFEKAMPGIQGLGQVVNQWFAKYSLVGYEFVNREQDMGIPGLRQAKGSYYPHHMVEKFKVILKPSLTSFPVAIEPHECDRHS